MALDLAIHYYYSGGNLIQEFDEIYSGQTVKDNATCGYLQGFGGKLKKGRCPLFLLLLFLLAFCM